MHRSRRSVRHAARLPVLILGLSLVASACGSGGSDGSSSSSSEGPSGEIFISGSSTVEPISVRVQELFNDVNPDVLIAVDGPGTGDGFVLFCSGETDISNASRAIRDSEAEECAANGVDYVELQVGIDGLGVMTNASNDLVECVSFADLYALTGPEATGYRSWGDANGVSAELGGAGDLPDAPLDIFGPGEESGTFDTFVELVVEHPAEERGQAGTTRPDYSPSGDDNVILQGITGSDTSLGWVGFAFASGAQGVKLLDVDGGESGCVAATAETIASGEYPLSRPLFVYVNSNRAANNPGLEAYVDFYMDAGLDRAVAEVGYVELTDAAKAEVRAAWTERT
ncbi:MAG: substrate-binding domain-containing protein [Acidimicrobiaceae bacterium]|nr:substrate-binding domain-containing protein [Acidimicrobiaceae bacterium]MDE0607246.1 substrate-binding domain-containing protein [Acidimicrobiaceae bacterium]